MDPEEVPAQRPFTLDITVEDISTDLQNETEPSFTQPSSTDNVLLQEESIDLGGGFATPQEDSSATPTESLMEKLNDQMMESVMISDSPNNSEGNDVVPIDSILDGDEEEEEENVEDAPAEQKGLEIGQNRTNIEVSGEVFGECDSDVNIEMDTDKQTNTQEEATTSVSPEDGTQFDVKGEEKAPKADPGAGSKEEPVPVCTIFSQGSHPKSLVPDGFQPTLIKSPSFSIGSGGGSNEAVTPSKLATPLVCQPSPSLSKFFTENEHVNPASDFFDSFTVPSSFISISNPNADVPPDTQSAPTVPTPDRPLSVSSCISSAVGSLDSSNPNTSTVFGPASGETTSSAQPPLPYIITAPTQAPVSSPVSQPQTFNQLQAVFSGNDDPFATALSLSEVDRRHDAWLPSEETRKVLISVATQQYSPSFVDTNRLTMPGLKFDNLQVGHVVQFQTCSFIKSIPFFVSYDVSFYALRNLQ